MTYRIVILPKARNQLYDAALWWAENRSTEQAVRWLDGFERKFESLAHDPERHPLAPESDAFPFPIRQLLYGLSRKKTHRAVFEVRNDQVIVHAVRHLAQDELQPDD